jgi:sarcosine oxidase, subunit beta
MSELPTHAAVVIVGGGVMGASTAYHLAERGQRDVLVLERDELFGQGATGKCAGGIRHQFGSEINIRLSQASIRKLEAFAAELGQNVDLRWPGYLFLITREADLAVFEHNVALQHRFGVETEWLAPLAIARRVPSLNLEGVLAGTFYAHDGLADPSSVVNGYVAGARRLGATLLTETPVTGVRVEDGRVAAVVTDRGEVQTELLVNAAGPYAAEVGRLLGLDLPIAPLRRQMLVTGPLADLPSDFPFVVDFGQSLYFHREGAGLLTGMSNAHQAVGFDETVDLDWERIHLEAAVRRLPLLEHAVLASHWAGLYEMTPDAHPLLGRLEPLSNAYVVAGFSGHGFMQGPIAGQLMAELLLDGRAHTLDVSVLDPSRFAHNRPIREYNVI